MGVRGLEPSQDPGGNMRARCSVHRDQLGRQIAGIEVTLDFVVSAQKRRRRPLQGRSPRRPRSIPFEAAQGWFHPRRPATCTCARRSLQSNVFKTSTPTHPPFSLGWGCSMGLRSACAQQAAHDMGERDAHKLFGHQGICRV